MSGELEKLILGDIDVEINPSESTEEAPEGLLSDRTVCVSRWRGLAPTSSMQVSVEDEIRNHRLTDISYDMISGGHEHEVR